MAGDNCVKIWVITGASSGLGRETALAAISTSHHVIGTSRDVAKAQKSFPEFSDLGGRWLQLDVSSPNAEAGLSEVARQYEHKYKEIDWTIVKNAGSTLLGAVEDMSDTQISNYLQANVVGFVRVWKATIPLMRRQKRGTLVSVSSLWGFVPKAEHMLYSAVKATIESLTESYATLLSKYGIQVALVEPGGFRTPFASNHSRADGGTSADYEDAIAGWITVIESAFKDMNIVGGDPSKFGKMMVEMVEHRGVFDQAWTKIPKGSVLRWIAGSDCLDIMGQRMSHLQSDHERMQEIASLSDAS